MKSIAFHLNNLERGGAERVVVTLSGCFARAGYRVLIATEAYGHHEFEPDAGVERVHVGLRKEDEGKGRLTKFRLREQYLRGFLLEYKPDVIVTFANKADYRALVAAKGTGVPVVVAIRTTPTGGRGHYDTFFDRFQTRRLFPRAAGAVFQTTGQRDFFLPHLRCKTEIIMNPINEKYYDLPAVPREKSVVHHARLVDFKNQLLLIRAFLRVWENHPDYVLKIYGEDSGDGTKQKLEALIAEHRAEDKVFLPGGEVVFEEVIPKGSVYVFSSDWEGLPNSLLEAMAMGMPVVATDCPCGGPATVIEDGVNGLLVPIKEEEPMAEAICRLIEDRELAERLGKEAAKIRERGNVEAVFSEWRNYLEGVCRGEKKGSEKHHAE